MKKSQITIFPIVFVIVTSSCRPSESQIVAAMAQTEIVRSATYVVETLEAKVFATESAKKTSAAQSTFQAATATRIHQETATRAAEETAVVESTILAATATASSMQKQVQELYNSGILSQSDGAYYFIAPEFDKLSEGFGYPWWDTGFAPADFVIRFDYSCPYAVQDDPSAVGLDFRQNNQNYYSLDFWSGRVRITRIIDSSDLDFEVPEDWQPGDDPIFIDMFTPLGGGAIPEDEKEIRFMLVVEGYYFTVFANGEKLFHAYNTILADGNLRLFRGLSDSDCQWENMELWILD